MSDREELDALRRMAELEAKASGSSAAPAPVAPAKPEPSFLSKVGQQVGNVAAGAVRGAGSIGATILTPVAAAVNALGGDMLTGEERRKQMDAGLQEMGADPNSLAYQGGKLGGEIAGTAGAGGVLANTLGRVAPAGGVLANTLGRVAPDAVDLANAVRAGGFAKNVRLGTNMAGGAITGAASAAAVNPDLTDAGLGAAVGGALPPVGRLLGYLTKPLTSRMGSQAAANSLAESAANRAAKEGLGTAAENKAAVLDALDNTHTFIPGAAPTVGEAVSHIPASATSALQRDLSKAGGGASDAFRQAETAQNNATVNALNPFSGGANKEERQLALDYAQALRENNARTNYRAVGNDIINPASDAALLEQQIAAKEASRVSALQNAGRMQTEAAQQGVLATGEHAADSQLIRNLPPGNVPRDPSIVQPPLHERSLFGNVNRGPAEQFAGAAQDTATIAAQRKVEKDLLTGQLDSLRQSVGPDAERSLFSIANRPSMEAAMESAAATAAEKGIPFPKSIGENFTVNQMQLIKKALDGQVEARTAKIAVKGLDNVDTAAIANTRSEFIKFLERKSPGWRNARDTFASDSIPVNQLEFNQELQRQLVTPSGRVTSAKFENALENGTKALKNRAGDSRYSQPENLLGNNPDNLDTIDALVNQVRRNTRTDAAEAAAGRSSEAAGVGKAQGAPHVGREGILADLLMKSVVGGGENAQRALANHMVNAQDYARLLRGLPNDPVWEGIRRGMTQGSTVGASDIAEQLRKKK